jgi:hypothetical protein
LLAGAKPRAEALRTEVDIVAEESSISLSHRVDVKRAALVVFFDHGDLLRH